MLNPNSELTENLQDLVGRYATMQFGAVKEEG
jgi:hypothetical protein